MIRPQSLIGERFVECSPTEPRRPGTEPPPPLEQIPDGEAGEGQYLLPLENNGTTVDIDLINNILRRPYADRFRLILNSLGAALGARGEELNEIVRRANPALRETDEVIGILAGQSRQLAKLNADSDAILTALARERDSLGGFLRSSGEVSAATAERRAELAENISLLPATLVELRQTMNQLGALLRRRAAGLRGARQRGAGPDPDDAAAHALRRRNDDLTGFARRRGRRGRPRSARRRPGRRDAARPGARRGAARDATSGA